MRNFIYFIKNYLINELEELLNFYEKINKKERIYILKDLRMRLDMLNFSN